MRKTLGMLFGVGIALGQSACWVRTDRDGDGIKETREETPFKESLDRATRPRLRIFDVATGERADELVLGVGLRSQFVVKVVGIGPSLTEENLQLETERPFHGTIDVIGETDRFHDFPDGIEFFFTPDESGDDRILMNSTADIESFSKPYTSCDVERCEVSIDLPLSAPEIVDPDEPVVILQDIRSANIEYICRATQDSCGGKQVQGMPILRLSEQGVETEKVPGNRLAFDGAARTLRYFEDALGIDFSIELSDASVVSSLVPLWNAEQPVEVEVGRTVYLELQPFTEKDARIYTTMSELESTVSNHHATVEQTTNGVWLKGEAAGTSEVTLSLGNAELSFEVNVINAD